MVILQDYFIHLFQMTGKEFWGKAFWSIMHYLPLHVKKEHVRSAYKQLISFYQYLLPCEMCRSHFIQNIAKYPVSNYEATASELFLHSWTLHDIVNRSKEIPSLSPTIQESTSIYFRMSKEKFEEDIWHILHITASLLNDGNVSAFLGLFKLFVSILGGAYINFWVKYPIAAFMRSDRDAFFYTYVFREHIISQKRQLNIITFSIPPYLKLKNYYYAALGQKCAGCNKLSTQSTHN